ncbi:MAG: succinate-semialdehyde dehydrogenase / glutarate-semialdehyde dehydrogenase [Rhodobacteraceae bacterium HLUCCA12]|nr:MAG: succinate-semialdehyde dehydrogenase / glutarate-semialdehyde dehydrogenase [Rhodobacteraceae bacterium HLUCCA12]
MTDATAYPQLALLIDGEWITETGAGEAVLNPADESELGHLPHVDTALLDRAAQAAARAFDRWSATPAIERKRILNRTAALLRERAEDIARWMSREEGKPVAEAVGEIGGAADIFEWYGDEAPRLYGRTVPARAPGLRHEVRRLPVGPVAGFAPWNFPALTPARKIAGALAAGCTIVMKPAEETPATAIAIARALMDAGLPPGCLNLVFGHPATISEYLIPHPAIRKISFTGSTAVGRHLGALAAQSVKRATMELGGHAPVVVCDDAALDQVVPALVAAKFRNAGQVCIAPSRFFVARKLYDGFVDRFAEAAAALHVGAGTEAGTQMGPLANDRRLAAMARLVDDAEARGLRRVTGGARVGNRGYFWQPTVLAEAEGDALVMREEPFGPIAPITPFDDLDEALSRANALPYGLAAYGFTGSRATSDRLAAGLRAGMVGVNSFAISIAELPFGGVGDSGYGSEGGTEGLDGYLETRLISQTV